MNHLLLNDWVEQFKFDDLPCKQRSNIADALPKSPEKRK
jgi:hypothetical protein